MDIASVIRNTRTNASMTRKELAEALEVSEKTVKNWEQGTSMPDAELFLKMFFVCNEHLEHYILKLKYPDLYGEMDEAVTDNQARQMLITYIRSDATNDLTTKLLYSLLGEHGSNAGAQVNLCCAYNHFCMEDKYEICRFIVERYRLRRDQGRLINMNANALPDLDYLDAECEDVRRKITNDG